MQGAQYKNSELKKLFDMVKYQKIKNQSQLISGRVLIPKKERK